MKNLRKRVTKSILSSTEKLTAADEDLVKESFTILNDLFSEVTITKNMLPSLITIIKLHTSTTEEMYTPEPYRLLKTVILKCTSLIYNPLLLDVHDFVRVQMVATNSKEIRDICKSICGVYLRDKASL